MRQNRLIVACFAAATLFGVTTGHATRNGGTITCSCSTSGCSSSATCNGSCSCTCNDTSCKCDCGPGPAKPGGDLPVPPDPPAPGRGIEQAFENHHGIGLDLASFRPADLSSFAHQPVFELLDAVAADSSQALFLGTDRSLHAASAPLKAAGTASKAGCPVDAGELDGLSLAANLAQATASPVVLEVAPSELRTLRLSGDWKGASTCDAAFSAAFGAAGLKVTRDAALVWHLHH